MRCHRCCAANVTHRRLFRLAAFSVVGTLIPGAAVLAQQSASRTTTARLTVTATASFDKDPLVDTVADGNGRINYSAGVIKATGHGAQPANAVNAGQAKLMAVGAAKADALRNLAMAVNSVKVTATTQVRNYVLENDVVRTEVSALLRSPRVVSEKINGDGTATVVVELPMYGEGSLAAAVLPKVLKEAPPVEDNGISGTNTDGDWKGPDKPAIRIAPPRLPRRVPSLGGAEPGLTARSDNGPFTSVIVDCRGLGVEAIMSPKLMDASGREVYGTVRVSHDYAIEVGIVGYPRSMAEALRTARCGSRPLIVRAIGVGDKFRFNPVVSTEDAERILLANSRDHFLEKTSVIFLVDPIRY